MRTTQTVMTMILAGLVAAAAGAVSGQDYPSKPIRILTAPAGGGSDTQARLVAQGISGSLGQPIIVENRNGVISAELLAKANPDGYTLGTASAGVWTSTLLRKTPYDVVRDFLPVSLISSDVNVMAVHPAVAAKSVKEFIALAKAKPGQLNYGIPQLGSSGHLATELFKTMAGVNIVQVTHKSTTAAITSAISGDVHVIINGAGQLEPHVKSGKLRALAVTSIVPSALAPGLPTVAASGLPGYESVTKTAILVPIKTPAAIIRRLNQEIVRFLRTPEAKEKFFNLGSEAEGSSPEQAAASIKSELAKLGKLIKDAGIKVD